MKAFDVKVRLQGRVLRFQALARCSCDVVCQCFENYGCCRVTVCAKGK